MFIIKIILLFIVIFTLILWFRSSIKISESFDKSKQGKIAFLFLTRDNLNLPEIWKHYFKNSEGKYSLYCHPKNPEKVNGILSSHIISENVSTSWGNIGTVRANLLLMKNALNDPNNIYFILCSESCIPITSFEQFYKFISKRYNTSFIPNFVESSERWDKIKNPVIKKEQFKKHCAQGLVFSRKHIEILTSIDETDNWKDMDCVDEHYFYNILYWQNPDIDMELENYKITYDVWAEYSINQYGAKNRSVVRSVSDNMRKKDNYATYEEITTEFIEILNESGYFFMRKVKSDVIGKDIILNFI